MKTRLRRSSLVAIVMVTFIPCELIATVEIFGFRSRGDSELFSIDATSGNARFLRSTGIFTGSGLAPGSDVRTLWAMSKGELYAVSIADGSSTLARDFGSALDGDGLAFDRERNRIYASDYAAGEVYCFEPSAGAPLVVTSGVSLHGLAYCSSRDLLYGVGTENLYSINVSTGESAVVGSLGVELSTGGSGLGYDPVADVLYAVSRNQSDLLLINPTTGVAVSAGATGTGSLHGLTVVDDGLPPALEILLVAEGLSVEFSGFLQSSSDLKTWTTIVPQPLSPYVLRSRDLDGALFFRASLNIEDAAAR